MRKQITAALMAVVALVFGVLALTSNPASGNVDPADPAYSSYTSTTNGNGVSVVVTGDLGGVSGIGQYVPGGQICATFNPAAAGGASVTISDTNKAQGYATAQADANGQACFLVPSSASGAITLQFLYTDAAGNQYIVDGVVLQQFGGVAPPPAPPVAPPPAPAPAPAPPAPTNNFGFGTNVHPDAKKAVAPVAKKLAHTGNESSMLGYVGTGLIAAGALALGSRRKYLQGALD